MSAAPRAPRRHVAAAWILGLATGCAADDKLAADFATFDTGSTGFAVRVDVHPAGDSELQPQSFTVPDIAAGSLLFEVAPTVTVSGRVTGYEIAPTASVVVPGNPGVAVQATVRAHIPDTIVDVSTTTDADGDWQLELPAGSGYVFSVLPSAPAPLPFSVETGVTLSGSQRRELDLPAGTPVFGQISQDGGALPEGSRARLRDVATGIEGLPVPLSSDGRYLLRALPGDYELVIEGETTSAMPRVALPLTVDDDVAGVEQNLNVGTLEVVYVEGRIFDMEGDDVDQAVVRFTSDDLHSQLTVEATGSHTTTTNNDGQFRRGLVPGSWTVEIMPAYEDDGVASPTRFSLELTPGSDQNLGRIELPARTQAQGQVVDSSGSPVSGAIVSFAERGFDGFTYSDTTRDNGQFSRRLPPVPMELTLVPPTPSSAVTRLVVDDPTELPRLQMQEGIPLSGKVSGTADPIEFALIEVYADDDGAFLGSTVTDREGAFSVQVRAAPEGLGDTGR